MGGNSNLLNITVLTDKIESKGLVTGGYLDSGASIGVTIINTSGGNYDNTAYNNIQFTSSGEGTSQKWSGGTVKLSATDGYCYAYYPYSSSATSITAIPVTAGGTDYMYATPVTVNDKDKNATLNMKHALAAIRFALKKGTYTGTGAVSSVSVASAALGASGTLNTKTGEVTAANKGMAVSQTSNLILNTTAQNVDVLMVPSGTAGTISLSVTIDGKTYSTSVSSTTIVQGSCYTYTLTVNAGNLALSGVKVGDWGYNAAGAPTITAEGYTVTFAGDYSDIAFINSVSGNTVTIKACSIGDENPAIAIITGTASILQPVDSEKRIRTITLSNISSDITITFNGLGSYWDKIDSGVYYIGKDGEYTPTASSSCIGVALINTAKHQKLMIEKYENANNAKSTTLYSDAAKTKGSSNIDLFSWGSYGYEQRWIESYTQSLPSRGDGYLQNPDGSYSGSPSLPSDPSTWESGALSDFAGEKNSEEIKNLTGNGSSSSRNAPMAYLLNAFNDASCSSSVNQGHRDWFIPSLGQLGLIWLNLTAINNALTAIGGTAFTATKYWTCSQYNAYNGWYVDLNNGYVDRFGTKHYGFRVRLVRNLKSPSE